MRCGVLSLAPQFVAVAARGPRTPQESGTVRIVRRGPGPGAGWHRRQLLQSGRTLAAGDAPGEPDPLRAGHGAGAANAVRGAERGAARRQAGAGQAGTSEAPCDGTSREDPDVLCAATIVVL